MPKFILSVMERHALANLLAQHAGDMGTLRVVREARETLEFTADEVERWSENCTACPGCTRNPESCRHRDREFIFPKSLCKLVTNKLRSMNDAKTLTVGLYSLTAKFAPDLVEEPEDDEKPEEKPAAAVE
jgi:hypothetical protein